MADNETFLPGYQLTEKDMVRIAMKAPLSEKIEIALNLFRHYEQLALKLDPVNGYYVCDSYGKDSDVICHLAKLSGVRHLCHHNVTSIDPPELMRYGKATRPETVRHHAEKSLLAYMVDDKSAGAPTRVARWCCQKYKEHGGDNCLKVIGVRAAESARRAELWETFKQHRKTGGYFLCPIIYWTTKDVWEFHRLYNLPHCELYDQGFHRLGCVGCPLSGPKNQRKEFDRWPLYERNWKRSVKAWCEKWHGVPTEKGKRRWFEDMYEAGGWEAVWQWWISGKGQGKKTAGCQMEFMWQ